MRGQDVMNRWFVVVGAIMIQLCLGAIYAWSVFTTPLVEMGWSKTQTQSVFAAGLALFAIVMVIAGRMLPFVGPRRLAMAGGVVLGLGYILAGLFATNALLQLVIIGLVAGLIIAGLKKALKPGTTRDLLMGAVAGVTIAALIGLPKYLGTQFAGIFLFVGILGGAGIGLAYVVPIAVGMRWFPDKKGLITGLAVAGFGFGAMGWVKLAGTWGNFLTYWGLDMTFVWYGLIFLVTVVIGGI